jgi:flagellar motility protein MotE (MotC chaperone)
MKPQEAARIFEQMDLITLVEMVERMSERKVAPVLAQMNPVRAKQVTTELSKRRKPGEMGAATPAAAPAPGG